MSLQHSSFGKRILKDYVLYKFVFVSYSDISQISNISRTSESGALTH